ncbi:MAG: aspartate aminotransferase family protein [Desulfobacterales bacterium]
MSPAQNPIIAAADGAIAATYKRFPIVLVEGSGASVWDSDGRRYTDFVAGIAVCNLGHAHPAVAEAICRQAKRLLHVSNLYYTVPQTELAAWLTAHSFADRVFFCNSGAEANEAALKLVRKYFNDRGETGRRRVVAMERSFHGRTFATLSATGQAKVRQGFEPVLAGFEFVPFNDIEALARAVDDQTAAVVLEPVQGEGGVRPPAPGYLQAVRALCDGAGALLVFDEIQTGIGRTGKLFAHEHFGVRPDIMTLAKALANGLPIGAMLATEKAAAAFGPGSHASTFGGSPIVTAAALEVVKALSGGLIAQAAATGAYFREQLLGLQSRHASIAEIRGLGLLLGMEISRDGDAIVRACMDRGYLINCIQGSILRFVPPLTISRAEIDGLVACLDLLL